MPFRLPLQSSLLPWVLICGYALCAALYFPWINAYEANPDEGFNLGKAALVSAGYSLYKEVWSDQPPLLTYSLALVQQWMPGSVAAARLLILAFACLLLASLYSLIDRRHGRWAACFAVLALMTAPLFLRLSVAVMIGLPAIALAVLAMAVASQRWFKWHVGAVLAGLIFALSLQTKFFTALLGPSLVLMLWLSRASAGRRHQLQAVGAFVAACCVGFMMVLMAAGDAFINQLLRPHFAENLRDAYSLERSSWELWLVLRRHPPLLLGALVGLVVLRKELLRNMLPVTVWLLLTTAALLLHTPVWNHHAMLLLPALAWLGGAGLAAAYQRARAHQEGLGRRGVVVLSCGLAILCVLHASTVKRPDPEMPKRAMGDLVQAFAPLGGWVMTDSPIDAFRAGLLVPPHLVVYAHKRLMTGSLTPADILNQLQTVHPHQVAFRRFPVDPVIRRYLDAHYVRTAAWGQTVHYVMKPDQLPNPISQEGVRRLLDSISRDFAGTSANGGFASAVTPNGQGRFGENPSQAIQRDSVWMRPPGSTPRIGACFLRSHQLTKEPQYLEWARSAAQAVARTQSCSGGWQSEATTRPTCAAATSSRPGPGKLKLDEGLTAEAITFLQALKQVSPQDSVWIDIAVIQALDFLVDTQSSTGAWPYSFGNKKRYGPLSTINDDLTTSHIRALLRGHQVYGREAYGQAVQQGVDFLLRTQSPEGGWAQQYDAQDRPAPARSFEPAALATIESAHVVRTLIAFDQVHPSLKVKKAIARGAKWLERVALGPNRWARFHDLNNGQPIYQDREGRRYARWTDLPAERRDGYQWEGAFQEVAQAVEFARAHLSGDPEQYAQTEKRLSAISDVSAYSKAIGVLGPYLKAGHMPLEGAGGLVWSKDFIENCQLLHALWQVH